VRAQKSPNLDGRRLDEEEVLAVAWPNSRLDSQPTEKQTKCDMWKLKSILHRTHLHRFFTDKATLSSLLAAQKRLAFLDGFPAIRPKDGSMLNIHCFRDRPIPDSEENVEERKDERKKLSD
jgi:hypothetical protein